jgi:putative nucleotidyltransferase with HDIG domain
MIVAVPVAAASGAGLLVVWALPQPSTLAGWAVWLVAMLGVGTVAGIAVERGVRRLGPLAWLVQLSIVFPDQAPSRFGLALRVSSTKRLRTWLVWERDSGRERNLVQHAEVVLGLTATLAIHDRQTRGHCERVRALTDLVAEELRLDPGTTDRLRWAALLHDIGKLHVPSQLLNKTTALTPHERAMVARHPVDGAQLAEPLLEWLGEPGRAIAEHHEHFDGTGYPKGLRGHGISLGGRVVALTDAFDTMTSVRSYKKAMSVRVARAEIARCAGAHFDPVIARAFLDMSLPRLWTVVGPLAVLAQTPLIGLTLRGALNLWEIPAALAAGGFKAIGAAIAIATGLVATGGISSDTSPRPSRGDPVSASVIAPPDPVVGGISAQRPVPAMAWPDPPVLAPAPAPAELAPASSLQPANGGGPVATAVQPVPEPPAGASPALMPLDVVRGVGSTRDQRTPSLPIGILQLPH